MQAWTRVTLFSKATKVSSSPCSVLLALSFVFLSQSGTFDLKLGFRVFKRRWSSCKERLGHNGRLGGEREGVLRTDWDPAHVWACLAPLGGLEDRDYQGHLDNQVME